MSVSSQQNGREEKPFLKKSLSVCIKKNVLEDFSEQEDELRGNIKNFFIEAKLSDQEQSVVIGQAEQKSNEFINSIVEDEQKEQRNFVDCKSLFPYIDKFVKENLNYPNEEPLEKEFQNIFDEFYQKLD